MIPQNKERLISKQSFISVQVSDFKEAERLFDEGVIKGDKTILKGAFVPESGIFEGWTSDNSKIKLRRADGELMFYDEARFKRCKFRTSDSF